MALLLSNFHDLRLRVWVKTLKAFRAVILKWDLEAWDSVPCIGTFLLLTQLLVSGVQVWNEYSSKWILYSWQACVHIHIWTIAFPRHVRYLSFSSNENLGRYKVLRWIAKICNSVSMTPWKLSSVFGDTRSLWIGVLMGIEIMNAGRTGMFCKSSQMHMEGFPRKV